jgi:hypothetical protein
MRSLDFPKCQDLTTEAYCISKSPVLPIYSEAKKGKKEGIEKAFLLPRNTQTFQKE